MDDKVKCQRVQRYQGISFENLDRLESKFFFCRNSKCVSHHQDRNQLGAIFFDKNCSMREKKLTDTEMISVMKRWGDRCKTNVQKLQMRLNERKKIKSKRPNKLHHNIFFFFFEMVQLDGILCALFHSTEVYKLAETVYFFFSLYVSFLFSRFEQFRFINRWR